jgi:hypothetical protein
MLEEQMEGCDFSKGDSLCCQKRKHISCPLFWGFFNFFVFFNFFKELEKE